MMIQATICLKVPFSLQLTETMTVFSKATQYAYDYARANKITSWKTLHQRLYAELRKRFRLHSQLTCKAIKFALETKKGCRNRRVDFSKELAIPYDQRSYSFDFSGQCSLSTLQGRHKCKLFIPDYYLKTYADWDITSAVLCKRGKAIFLNVVVKKETGRITSSPTNKVVGIDLGINNVATTSEKQFFRGVTHHIAKFQRLRSKLQSKGTASAKRHFRKLKGKQTRFMRSLNHEISKRIVSSLDAGDVIVMEDLRGITGRRKGKELNRLLHNWSFFQLRSMIEYKAVRKGIVFVTIPAAYSSKTCSRCHEIISIRPKQAGFFRCLNCGYSCNADLNASLNLRKRVNVHRNTLGLCVNQPIVGGSFLSSGKPMTT